MASLFSVFRSSLSARALFALCALPLAALLCLGPVYYQRTLQHHRYIQAQELAVQARSFAVVYRHALDRIKTKAPPLSLPAPDRHSRPPYNVEWLSAVNLPKKTGNTPDEGAFLAGKTAETLRALMQAEGDIELIAVDYQGIIVSADAPLLSRDVSALPDIKNSLAGAITYALRPDGDPAARRRLYVTLPVIEDNEIYGAVQASASFDAGVAPDIPLAALYAAIVLGYLASWGLLYFFMVRPLRRSAAGRSVPSAVTEMRTLLRRISEAKRETGDIRDLVAVFVRDFEMNSSRTIERLQEALKDKHITLAEHETDFLQRLVRASALYTEANVAEISRNITDPAPVADSLAPHDTDDKKNAPRILFNNKRRIHPLIGAGHLRIILSALYDNSRHAGATLVKIDVFPATGKRVRIVITDNGCGIKPNIREYMFKPFYSAKRDDGRLLPGLGLSTAQLLAHRYNGELICEPTPGGAVFTLTLPAAV